MTVPATDERAPRRVGLVAARGKAEAGELAQEVSGWLLAHDRLVLSEERLNADAGQQADAIVVLGAAQYEGRPSPVLKARLDHAIDLHRRGLAPLLIVTGGRGYGDTTTEAAVSQRYAMKRGVAAEAILLEDQGRTTSESMRAVAAMLGTTPESRRRVILVSDPFHMLRLDILARRFGLVPYTSPTRTSPISANTGETWRYYINESLKIPFVLIMERPRS